MGNPWASLFHSFFQFAAQSRSGSASLLGLSPLTKRTQCITLQQNMGRVQHGYCTTCQLVLPGRREGYGLRMGNVRSLVISTGCCGLSEEFRTFDSPATEPPLALLKMCQGRLEMSTVQSIAWLTMMRKVCTCKHRVGDAEQAQLAGQFGQIRALIAVY